MIDNVTIGVPDLAVAWAFYGRAMDLIRGPEPIVARAGIDWGDFSLTEESSADRVTRRLHLAFRADSTRLVDEWWEQMVGRGYRSDGTPGRRPAYGADYYGGFVLDPLGNSIEAVNDGARRSAGMVDHFWLRTPDLDAATRFYEIVCPTVDHTVERYEGRTQIRGSGATFSIVEGEPTRNLRLAFRAGSVEAVTAFHEAAIEAGYASIGMPGERLRCHGGCVAAHLTDPDGHDIAAVFHDG